MMRSAGVAVVCLLLAGQAAAQVGSGRNEINVNAHVTITSADGESETAAQLQGRYGRFFSDRIQIGLTAALIKLESIDLFGDVGPFAAYHFGAPGATTVPYVGAGFSAGFGRPGDDPFSYGGFAGLKFFVGPSGAFSTEAFYTRMSITTSAGDFDLDQLGVRLGISIFF